VNTGSLRLSSGRRSRARGLSLVELMISMVLGLVLMGGAFIVFMGSQTGFKTSDNLSRMQDSARIAFVIMSREIREAGSTGCGNGSRIDTALYRRNASILNAAQTSPPAWWSVMADGIQGFDAGVTTPAVGVGTAAGERVAGTAAIRVAGAFGSGFSIDAHDDTLNKFTLNTGTSGISANDVLIACDYKQSTIFVASSVAATAITYATSSAGNCGTALGYDMTGLCPATDYNYDPLVSRLSRFGASTWYIGKGADGRSSLFRIFLDGVPEEIATGVSNMQLVYLQEGGLSYVSAATVADWSKVLAVRVTLSFEGQSAGVSTDTSGNGRLTTETTSTVMLRNRAP
jgi:type IV pilus assembly protein PilW